MLSYHADADIHTNPYEVGMGRLVNLDMEANFIGKEALRKIRDTGVSRKQVGLVIEGAPLKGSNTIFWPVHKDGAVVGKVTSAIYSPRLKQNIALAMVSCHSAEIGQTLEVITSTQQRQATVVEKPFFDPKKKIAAT